MTDLVACHPRETLVKDKDGAEPALRLKGVRRSRQAKTPIGPDTLATAVSCEDSETLPVTGDSRDFLLPSRWDVWRLLL